MSCFLAEFTNCISSKEFRVASDCRPLVLVVDNSNGLRQMINQGVYTIDLSRPVLFLNMPTTWQERLHRCTSSSHRTTHFWIFISLKVFHMTNLDCLLQTSYFGKLTLGDLQFEQAYDYYRQCLESPM